MGKVTVQRFYRPEDVGREHAYQAEFWELYASDETAALDPDDVFGKCAVVREGAPTGAAHPTSQQQIRAWDHHIPVMWLHLMREPPCEGSYHVLCSCLCSVASNRMCSMPAAGDNTFMCTKSYSRKTGEFGEPPAELRAPPAAGKGKGKAAAASSAPTVEAPAADEECGPWHA